MNLKNIALSLTLTMQTGAAMAGGLLMNTNQHAAFLRNPARDAMIGLDGVITNPAGVAFLSDGFHLALTIQNAKQSRDVETDYPLFVNNRSLDNPANPHLYHGKCEVPVLPSLHAAYNKDGWSFQFAFAVLGGGGKCEFDGGLGSFEQVVASVPMYKDVINQLYAGLAAQGLPFGGHTMGTGYGYDSYMRGRQYYYGFTFGAARKLTEQLSVSAGLRMYYATSNYYGYVRDIQVEHQINGQAQMVGASEHFAEVARTLDKYSGAMEILGQQEKAAKLDAYANQVRGIAQATGDITLNCDQTGWGVAPIIGIDWHPTKRWNISAKYEFKTRMRLKNKSANSESAAKIEMLDKFADGRKVAGDMPAQFGAGASCEVISGVTLSAGYHHYFDQDTKQYSKDELDDTNEYLFGAEVKVLPWLTLSAGGQRVKYGMTDKSMSDISFNCDSWSYGCGFEARVSDKVAINAGFFKTLYDDYNKEEQLASGLTVKNSYTRKNRVFGVSLDYEF